MQYNIPAIPVPTYPMTDDAPNVKKLSPKPTMERTEPATAVVDAANLAERAPRTSASNW